MVKSSNDFIFLVSPDQLLLQSVIYYTTLIITTVMTWRLKAWRSKTWQNSRNGRMKKKGWQRVGMWNTVLTERPSSTQNHGCDAIELARLSPKAREREQWNHKNLARLNAHALPLSQQEGITQNRRGVSRVLFETRWAQTGEHLQQNVEGNAHHHCS